MDGLNEQVREAVAAVREKTSIEPQVGIVLGTGLGDLSGVIESPVTIPYSDIPHMPDTAVESHAGELVIGTIGGRGVMAFRGRVHFYEGYSMQEATFSIRLMKGMGADTVILNSAVGGMNPLHPLGSIVIVDDHINLMGDNPLIGPNDDSMGPRFPDMSEPYTQELIGLTEEVARSEAIPTVRGVFVGVAGPNLETRAEYRFLRQLGADIVGMSIVPENIVAVHGSLRVLAFGVVTDRCLPDALEPVDIAKVLEIAGRTEPLLTRLIRGVVSRL
jgi:purine-nucleoside phosphorylase